MVFIKLGAVMGATGVAFGCFLLIFDTFSAFGSHYLRKKFKDQDAQKAWDTAAHYQILHAMPLMYIGNKATLRPAGFMLATGIALFSGSIYSMSLWPKSKREISVLTPFGGALLIAGWLTIAWLW